MKPDSDFDGAITEIGLAEQKAASIATLHHSPRLKTLTLLIAIAASSLLYFTAFHPDRFGFYRDDSMYVVLGKALASGQGYRVISLPEEPVQTKSPPFYPFLLSLIWRLKPEFPQNLTAMMLLSAAMTIAFLALSYRYLVKKTYARKWQALVVISLAAVNWRTIVLASGIYSEMVYAALSVAALYIAEEYENRRRNWVMGSVLGLITGLAFLTRSAGVALLIALVVYFLLRRKRNGLLPILVAGVFVFGWFCWGYLNGPTTENTSSGSYESYFQTFRALFEQNGQSNLTALLSLIARNALGLILISIPVVCLGLAYESVFYFGFAFLFIAGGFIRQSRGGLRLMHVYVITYLAVHLLWPYTSYDRFLMPLLPFLLLFMLIEVQTIFALITDALSAQKQLIGRASAGFIGLALVVLVCAFLYNYGLGFYRSLSLAALSKAAKPSSDDGDAIEWIKSHTAPSDVLICYRDPLYFLYTGRAAARSSVVRDAGLFRSSQADVEDAASTIFSIAQDNKARYLVLTQSDFGLEHDPDLQRQRLKTLLEQTPEVFDPVFRSADASTCIYRIREEITDRR